MRGGAAEGADHAEGREVDADRLQPRVAERRERGFDHVAPGGDDDDVDFRARLRPPRRRPRRRPDGREPPGRSASGSAPGPGSGPPRRAPRGPRSPAASGCGRRPAGWRGRGGPAWRACARRRADFRRVGERVGVDDLAVAERRRRAAARSPCADARGCRWRRTSVAAMLPASISRPTSDFSLLFRDRSASAGRMMYRQRSAESWNPQDLFQGRGLSPWPTQPAAGSSLRSRGR